MSAIMVGLLAPKSGEKLDEVDAVGPSADLTPVEVEPKADQDKVEAAELMGDIVKKKGLSSEVLTSATALKAALAIAALLGLRRK